MNPQAEAANQRMRERRAASCIHFTGFKPDGQCKAGIPYATLVPRLMPCIPAFKSAEEGQRPTCPKFTAMGMEAVIREDAEFEVLSQQTNRARDSIMNHFLATDESRGRIGCPVCGKANALRYSIARSNQHVHARCDTPDCVNWME